jgi:Protein of unknown function (DUF1553)/Protein of unknown function (DUF1549)/Planctomycete cytochrome C
MFVSIKRLSVHHTLAALVMAVFSQALFAANDPADTLETIDFARDIRPILGNNCLKCHGPDPSSREADLRLDNLKGILAEIAPGIHPVVPGEPEESELFLRITEPFPEDRMPPPETGLKLTSLEIDLLRQWIQDGAPWQEHWSLEPPHEPIPPVLENQDWPRADLDRFVLSRMHQAGLSPNPPADRYTLIRRLSLDLIGLPPTPEQVKAFVNSTAPDAYERLVDSLLESPHYGQRWASLWLDLARYADTKGYEADRRRTMWPYRDWVVNALNEDMPFDEFTVEQLAGDLLPNATDKDLVATGFHRNTMTNDEGGTDDEEFRVAAVMDRVNTTMTVWMGMTMGCARCHTHKYDPITHEDYYKFFAIFNNTADTDRMDEEPKLTVLSRSTRDQLATLYTQRDEHRRQLDAMVKPSTYHDPGRTEPKPGPAFVPIIDNLLPSTITPDTDDPWPWSSEKGPHAETRVWTIEAGDLFKQRFFTGMYPSYTVVKGDILSVAVRIDPDAPTRELMLQVHTTDDSWEHRAYWGENLIAFGTDNTPARLSIADRPEPGQWMTLEVQTAALGLSPGDQIDGLAFSQHAGRVSWSRAGVLSTQPTSQDWLTSMSVWLEAEAARDHTGLDENLQVLARTNPADERIVRYYLERVHTPTRLALIEPTTKLVQLTARINELEHSGPSMPIMRELEPDARRTTHLLEKGSYLSPAQEVSPGIPEVFAGITPSEPTNRLELAGWVMHPDNPLTSRVLTNRIWAAFFGTGIVSTLDDFGTQGALPTHPELLDWLALDLIESGWSMKQLCRTIVTSATYRQSSLADSEKYAQDPFNTWLARAPRTRLEAEMIRDSALAVSGLLNETLGGPPVFPPQPDGVWKVVYTGDKWTTSIGPDRYRRALYTFWRRTSPYPSMMSFDAPTRELCVARRIRTNTPLQALITFNDPVFVEAAQALARRMMGEAPSHNDPRSIAARGVFLVLSRPATELELDELISLFAAETERLAPDPQAAAALAGNPPVEAPADAIDTEIAAWTSVALVLLNLDEFLTRD